MWLDSTGQTAVNTFWQGCGELEPFPRSLERSLEFALPIKLVDDLSGLMLHDIEGWLKRRGVSFRFDCRSRAVRGCLVAAGGRGLIFIDGADPDDERRFTVAHETAHFIVDYWLARQTAIEKFGEQITDVFDGLRRASAKERLHSLIAGAGLGVYTKLIERGGAGDAVQSEVWEIEDRADRVALALLAPPDEVLASADVSAPGFEVRRACLEDVLCERFGLPKAAAFAYATSLLADTNRGPSWVESLRLR
jgi:hypothetical protein